MKTNLFNLAKIFLASIMHYDFGRNEKKIEFSENKIRVIQKAITKRN